MINEIIFDKRAQRVGKVVQQWGITIAVVVMVCVLFALITLLIFDGKKSYMPGALIVIPLTWLFRNERIRIFSFTYVILAGAILLFVLLLSMTVNRKSPLMNIPIGILRGNPKTVIYLSDYTLKSKREGKPFI